MKTPTHYFFCRDEDGEETSNDDPDVNISPALLLRAANQSRKSSKKQVSFILPSDHDERVRKRSSPKSDSHPLLESNFS